MEAAGLASSILTFLDVSYKIAKGTYEIYESATGATAENIHVSNVITDLEKAVTNLGTVSMSQDAELSKLSEKCRALSTDLLKLLSGLERREQKVFESFKAAIASARKQKDIASIEKRLEQYRQQIILHVSLNIYREQSPIKIQLERIRDDSTRFENEHAAKLVALHFQLSEVLEIMRRPDLRPSMNNQVPGDRDYIQTHFHSDDELRRDEVTGASNTTTHDPSIIHQIDKFGPVDDKLRDLAKLLNDFKSCANALESENKTLGILYFDTIFQREDSISTTTSDTFAWIVEGFMPSHNSKSNETAGSYSSEESQPSAFISPPGLDDEELLDHDYIDWEKILLAETHHRRATSRSLHSFLKDEGEVFFICGKAGSGKSTLMKFLGRHPSVGETLAGCANGRKLVLVNMFFWSSGDSLQKSLEGFYRTILFHTLSQCPELLEMVFPNPFGIGLFTRSAAMPLSELEAAFSRLQLLKNTTSYLFCYFIDGLDEYEGDALDQKRLAEMLETWARADNVKIICSARPSTVNLDIFGASKTFFELHHLTKADIYAFSKTRFEEYLSKPIFAEGREACLGMVQTIVARADGVFLWASLVVRALLNAALEHEDKFSIRRRLKECPQSLNQLFHQMLDSVDPSPSVRLRSAVLLQLVASREHPRVHLNALTLSWLDESRTLQTLMGLPSRSCHQSFTESRIRAELKKAQSQLRTLTRGLIEIVASQEFSFDSRVRNGSSSYYKYQLGFFHRTVQDYLTEEWLPSLTQRPLGTAQQEATVKAELLIAEMTHCPEPHLGSSEGGHSVCYSKLVHFFTVFQLSPIQELDIFTALVQELAVIFCGASNTRDACSEQKHTSPWLSRTVMVVRLKQQKDMGRSIREPFSFLHLAAIFGMTGYIKQTVASIETPAMVDTSSISLLLSGAQSDDPALVDFLLQKGWHPNDLVSIWNPFSPSTSGSVSVWEAFLFRLTSYLSNVCASRLRGPVRKAKDGKSIEHLNDMFSIVQSFLHAGAEPKVEVLIREYDEGAFSSTQPIQDMQVQRLAPPTYRLSFSQILQLAQPTSLAVLQTLSANEAKSKRSVLSKMLGRTTIRKHQHPGELASYPMATMEFLSERKWKVEGLVSLAVNRVYLGFRGHDVIAELY